MRPQEDIYNFIYIPLTESVWLEKQIKEFLLGADVWKNLRVLNESLEIFNQTPGSYMIFWQKHVHESNILPVFFFLLLLLL